MPTTTRQLAKIADVAEQTIRNYTRDYADLLSPQARGDAGPRLFSDADVQTVCTIATLRKEDVPRAEIIERLTRGDIVIDATPSPHQATPNAQEGQGEALIAPLVLSTMQRQMDAIQRQMDTIQRNQSLISRNDKLQGALWGAIAAFALVGLVLWAFWLLATIT